MAKNVCEYNETKRLPMNMSDKLVLDNICSLKATVTENKRNLIEMHAQLADCISSSSENANNVAEAQKHLMETQFAGMCAQFTKLVEICDTLSQGVLDIKNKLSQYEIDPIDDMVEDESEDDMVEESEFS